MARDIFLKYVILGCLFAVFAGCASAPKAPKTAAPPTSAAVGNNTTIVAIAPAPSASSCTLPQFLGLPAIGQALGGGLQRIGSRLLNGLDLTGRFPGLQPTPPVLPLTDPANMEEGAPPAVQAAAEIKQEEDAAPQKIMALRYLATLGCGGCYEKVEDALLEGMGDCTEAVRFEAVKALQCRPECGCKFCNAPSCCSLKIRKKLMELTTCEKEPSARIRRMARIALQCCSGKPIEEEDIPREGPPATTGGVVKSSSTELFRDIELVSFQESESAPKAGEMILAEVNGETIMESQVLPLVEARLRDGRQRETSLYNSAIRRKELMIQTYRMIDWKLISQQAKNGVQLAGGANETQYLNSSEIRSWFEHNVNIEQSISPSEILAYYEVHRDQFRAGAKARWEQIHIDIDQCDSRADAIAVATYLMSMANRIKVESPAAFHRDLVNTKTQGWSDCSTSEPALLRSSLRTLKIGQISQPIEDGDRVYLVRVLERQNETVKPLSAVADQVKKEILAERKRSAEMRLLAQLRAQSKIWTVFDSACQLNTEDFEKPSVSTKTDDPVPAPSSLEFLEALSKIPMSSEVK